MQKRPIGIVLISLYLLLLSLYLFYLLTSNFGALVSSLGLLSVTGQLLSASAFFRIAVSFFVLRRLSLSLMFAGLFLNILVSIIGLSFEEIVREPIIGWVIGFATIFYLFSLARRGVLN